MPALSVALLASVNSVKINGNRTCKLRVRVYPLVGSGRVRLEIFDAGQLWVTLSAVGMDRPGSCNGRTPTGTSRWIVSSMTTLWKTWM